MTPSLISGAQNQQRYEIVEKSVVFLSEMFDSSSSSNNNNNNNNKFLKHKRYKCTVR